MRSRTQERFRGARGGPPTRPRSSNGGSLGFLFLAAICCSGAAAQAEDGLPTDPLPRPFRGVTWTTTSAELKSSFSTEDVFETSWTCRDGSRCVTWGTTVAGWPAFGHAQVELSARVGESARLISITAVDPREACRPEATSPRPKGCLDEPGPAMDAAFERMRRLLEAQLGRGERLRSYSSGTAHGYPRDPRERAVRWQRRGYAIELRLGADEFGWSVEIQAFRGW